MSVAAIELLQAFRKDCRGDGALQTSDQKEVQWIGAVAGNIAISVVCRLGGSRVLLQDDGRVVRIAPLLAIVAVTGMLITFTKAAVVAPLAKSAAVYRLSMA